MENLTLTSIKLKKEKKELKLNNLLEEIKKEMLLNNIYYKKAKFGCFGDNIFSYYYNNHATIFEFSFICKDSLLDKMTIKELLELKNIVYFSSSIYDKSTMNRIRENKSFSLNANQAGIDLYNELTENLFQGDKLEALNNGVYISDGVYLNSDGSYTEC